MNSLTFVVLSMLIACSVASAYPSRMDDKCVPAPRAGICTSLPDLVGSSSLEKCRSLNDPKKAEVMSGLKESCINGIEKDGPDCLQAALDLACSFHCGRCVVTTRTDYGYVEGICPEVCDAIRQLCPISHTQLNCFEQFSLAKNCRADLDCSRHRIVRGDLAKIVSGASQHTAGLVAIFAVAAAMLF
mmetsp:Transcript_10099/g.25261  ORF Transcript_10099/g.25261 Transcript_10099/m.25261 type:complete len:187 (-) Transcript_10099:115-675(-)